MTQDSASAHRGPRSGAAEVRPCATCGEWLEVGVPCPTCIAAKRAPARWLPWAALLGLAVGALALGLTLGRPGPSAHDPELGKLAVRRVAAVGLAGGDPYRDCELETLRAFIAEGRRQGTNDAEMALFSLHLAARHPSLDSSAEVRSWCTALLIVGDLKEFAEKADRKVRPAPGQPRTPGGG